MKLELSKGMSLELAKTEGLTKVAVGVNWGKIEHKETVTHKVGGFLGFGGKEVTEEVVTSKQSVDLDISALLYDKNNKFIGKVYYANKVVNGIVHSGDDTSGDDVNDGKDNETIEVTLAKTQPAVAKIVFILVSFRGQKFGRIPYAQMKLYDISSRNKTLMADTNIDISKETNYNDKTSMVFAKLENTNGEWNYTAICEPTPYSSLSQLETIANKY
jgi:tellurium resistance protein TerZ